MRYLIIFSVLFFSHSLYAKEWKCLREFQKVNKSNILPDSDWLKSDRKRNTQVWHKANLFNLKNSFYEEYNTIVQRRDFYQWMSVQLRKKGHDIVWSNMAHFISKKMHLMEVFPYSIFTKKEIKNYARQGSAVVFKNAIPELRRLFYSEQVLKLEAAEEYDKNILYKEQYIWINSIYKEITSKSLKTLERIAKRKFLYGLVVPKAIEYDGELVEAEERYNYAVKILRPYCKKAYK